VISVSIYLSIIVNMADNHSDDQDDTIILRKRQTPKRGPSSTVSRSLTNDFDPATAEIPRTSNREMGLAIQQGRATKGIKQVDLDAKCRFPKGTTASYESGKAIYKPVEVNRIASALGITIPRPSKPKP
jgi:ribosome-binding protein aMBF1 (putative translation factor)